MADDPLVIAGREFGSRLILGTGGAGNLAVLEQALLAAQTELSTVAIRRMDTGARTGVLDVLMRHGIEPLPNTAGCRSVREAVTTAKLARELFGTSWIKLEVIADNDTLQPDVVGLVEAADILIKDGFEVFPYCTEDLSVAMRLVDAGCKVVMPWAAPIGSAKGIINRDALKLLRDRLPDITLVVDAGIGAPSHAAHALELGYDAVLLNTAIAKAALGAGADLILGHHAHVPKAIAVYDGKVCFYSLSNFIMSAPEASPARSSDICSCTDTLSGRLSPSAHAPPSGTAMAFCPMALLSSLP